MPLTVYISRRLDLLGHDIGQITAHEHSTCRAIEHVATSWKIWRWWLQSLVTASRTKNFWRKRTPLDLPL